MMKYTVQFAPGNSIEYEVNLETMTVESDKWTPRENDLLWWLEVGLHGGRFMVDHADFIDWLPEL